MSAPPSDMGERLASLAGPRPWWPSVEPSSRWVRVRLGDELVADSRRAMLFVQYGPDVLPPTFLPTYFFPADDVVPGTLVDFSAQAGTTTWTVQAGGRRVEGAAWSHAEPPPPLEALAGMITFSWRDGLTWFEEDEQLFAHARDPHKRVDVAPSSRHVRVEVDGELLAESRRPLLLFETALPTRYYLPPEDVRMDRLVATDTRTRCPYKGEASYWRLAEDERDIAWSYQDPIPECPKIKGLIAFFNERVDGIVVDGEPQPTPRTAWS